MKLVTLSEKTFLDNSVGSDSSTLEVDIIIPRTQSAINVGNILTNNIQPISGTTVTIGSKTTGGSTTAIATSDGLTTGLLGAFDQFVTVTSASANNIISLPKASTIPVGSAINGVIGANGFKLQVIAADAATVTLNNVTTSVKAAIPANVSFKVQLISATAWILTTVTALGAVGTAIVPA